VGIIRIGSTVIIEVNGKEKTYSIVGSNEANPLQGLISNESPIGSALLGKKENDTAEVEAPAGRIIYKIKKVS